MMTIVHHIVIAVLTFRRPADIRAVLPVLAREAAGVAGAGVEVRVQVVDNDPEGSAADAVAELARELDVRVDYVVEPTPGISAARNRALATATDDDVLVFIDDDERPEPGWLAALLATWRAGGAEAVVGPVVSTFEVAPDAWMEAGGFFVRRRLATGTEVAVAATNNLLLQLDFVRAHGLRFDLDFGITGGDDTMFTRELVRAGGRIVWCAEAMVVDVVPAARVTHRWVMLRAFSSGNSWSTTSAKLARTPGERLRAFCASLASGAARVALGCARVAAGILLRSQRHRARGARTIARGLGMVTGAVGYGYQEYRRG